MTQAAAAFELGPTGFVLKLSTGQELLEAVDHVSHGNTYITPKLRAGDWLQRRIARGSFPEN
jgi:DNA-binding NarL/FixJ family response regulator